MSPLSRQRWLVKIHRQISPLRQHRRNRLIHRNPLTPLPRRQFIRSRHRRRLFGLRSRLLPLQSTPAGLRLEYHHRARRNLTLPINPAMRHLQPNQVETAANS